MNESDRPLVARPEDAAYEAPGVEAVLTPEELEREVQYAGFPITNP